MATSLNSLLGGIYTGPSGFSGYSGAGVSGFSGFSGGSGYSGTGNSGFSGYSGTAGASGFSGPAGFNGGTITNPLIVNNATVATSVGSGALQVVGGAGFASPVYVSGNLFVDGLKVLNFAEVVLQQDVSISTTSAVANLSGFSFPLSVVGATYGYKFYILYRSPATGAALGAAITVPGFRSFAGRAFLAAGVAGTAGTYSGNIAASGVKVQSVSLQAINTTMLGLVEGTITVSTSGVLQLQVANAFGAVTTSILTILSGTTGMVWRID